MTAPRVRFAPSPTGALHIGSVRTALFNWLAARAAGGTFVLRIEDTDRERRVPGAEAQILASLRWLGLDWDEGPGVGGPHRPYVQSERTPLYVEATERLLASGAAYWCTCTPERLSAMRAEQREARVASRYDRHCLDRQDEVARERAAGQPAVVRQRMPTGSLAWDDRVRGAISYEGSDVDDGVLLKSDGFPTYHLANVVDDHLMAITDVIRAEEWIPSTPKHLALYAALGWEPPAFAHVPVVLGPDRQKLSKRRGAPDVLRYRDDGYLPDAVVNAMALLGWAAPDGAEVLTREELVAQFSVDRVNAAPAIFDPARLDALNGQHIRRLPDAALAAALRPWLPGVDEPLLAALLPVLRERLPRLDAAPGLVAPVTGEPEWDEALAWPPDRVDADTAAALLDAAVAAVERGGLDDIGGLRAELTAVLDDRGVRARHGFRVLYLAVLGTTQGLPVFDVMRLIGLQRSAERLREARARLGVAGAA